MNGSKIIKCGSEMKVTLCYENLCHGIKCLWLEWKSLNLNIV